MGESSPLNFKSQQFKEESLRLKEALGFNENTYDLKKNIKN
jgi:hypothetical protein